MELIEVQKIWDKAPHNAFTDLISFNNKFYCTFRESSEHMSFDGGIRILSSTDGKNWESVTLLESDGKDLRDPKFSITPTCELMLNAGVRLEKAINGSNLQSLTWFSPDGKNWSESFSCSTNLETWRWSTTWYKNTAYSFAYSGKHKQGCLYDSRDGKDWRIVKDDVYPFDKQTKGNETSLLFLEKGKAFCLLRRDGGDYTTMLGSSNPPYTKWKWRNMGVPIGGPKMISITKNRFLAAVRLYDKEVRTSLCWINPKKATLKEALKLPSGNDCSYAGLVYDDKDFIWVSYYSSHEGKSAIYLAKVKI